MKSQFKPLEEIAKDKDVNFGDLIMLRRYDFYENKKIVSDTPVFYGGIDKYISDGSAGLKKDEVFEGIRIFHYRRENECFEANTDHTVFYHHKKGLLIPFNYRSRGKYKYSLLMNSSSLPK